VLGGPSPQAIGGDKTDLIEAVQQALFASKLVSYAQVLPGNASPTPSFLLTISSQPQGFVLIKKASEEYKWDIDLGACSLMWRGGCIIRSTVHHFTCKPLRRYLDWALFSFSLQFLGKIKEAFDKSPDLENLLLDSWFVEKIMAAQSGWRKVVGLAVANGISCPAFTAALTYYDGYRTPRLPANLLQAQRDYFGAHQYERVDKPRGEFFHTNW